MNKERMGLFGGTFNPPHIGHLLIAKNVQKQFGIRKVVFIPAYIPPHKQQSHIIDAKHRINMTKMLIENEPNFIVSNFEIVKSAVSYTIDTVKYFKNEFPNAELFFILGADNFFYIETWKDYLDLLKMVNFTIYMRRGFTKEKIIEKHKAIINEKVLWSNSELIDISSSEIRERIKNGENCIEDVGERVWEYIVKNKLYR